MTVTVKICGITSAKDAELAVSAGADFVGCVLYERSPRHVTLEQAAAVVAALPAHVPAVAVVVNRPLRYCRELLDGYGFSIVQLHGDENSMFAEALGVTRTWRALGLTDEADVTAAAAYPAAAVVADASVPGRRGGTGVVGNWKLAAGLASRCRLFLAGGLTVHNVSAAIEQVKPYGVDVSSGVEAAPGRKDPVLIREFITQVRQAQT